MQEPSSPREPGATVGPPTRISPSGASATRVQKQREAARRHLRARLGEAVGRHDGHAGRRPRARSSAGGIGPPPSSTARSARRLAQAGVEQAGELRRDERDERRVGPSSAQRPASASKRRVDDRRRGVDRASAAGSTGRRRARAAARTASARRGRGRARRAEPSALHSQLPYVSSIGCGASGRARRVDDERRRRRGRASRERRVRLGGRRAARRP